MSVGNEVMQLSLLRLNMYPRTGYMDADSRFNSMYGSSSWSGVSPLGSRSPQYTG